MIKRFQVTDPPGSGSYHALLPVPNRRMPHRRYLTSALSLAKLVVCSTIRSTDRIRGSGGRGRESAWWPLWWPFFPLEEACQSRVTRLCALVPISTHQGEQTTTSWNRLACDDVRRRRPTTKPGRARARVILFLLFPFS